MRRQQPEAVCDNWILPPVGTTAVYDVEGPNDVRGEVTLRCEAVHPLDDEWLLEWVVSARMPGDPSAELGLVRRCHPERRAGDPGSGHLFSQEMEMAEERWRWPPEPVVGERIGRRIAIRALEAATIDDPPEE